MLRQARLPPLFRLTPIGAADDVAAEAARAAKAGADPGTVICAEREDILDCAVILHPDMPREEAILVLYVATLGLGDAIGAEAPAGIDVTYRWPNLLDANIGSIARLDLELPADAADSEVPEWLAVRVRIQVGPLDDDWREDVFPETSLHNEGAVEVTVSVLLESFCRHFLTWLNRWQQDGFEPVRAMWLRHAPAHDQEIDLVLNSGQFAGAFAGIGDDGALELDEDGTRRRFALVENIGEQGE